MKINRDIHVCNTPSCTKICSILVPSYGAESHYSNTNPKQPPYITPHVLHSVEKTYVMNIHYHKAFNREQPTLHYQYHTLY